MNGSSEMPTYAASHWYGPPPENDCPCGSHRQATRCHRANDGSWIAEPPPPPLTGPRTGYANPDCYARASKDCDEELTREHFITDDVLGAISADGKVVVVEGAAWQDKTERRKTMAAPRCRERCCAAAITMHVAAGQDGRQVLPVLPGFCRADRVASVQNRSCNRETLMPGHATAMVALLGRVTRTSGPLCDHCAK